MNKLSPFTTQMRLFWKEKKIDKSSISPFPKQQILDSSKLKESADDNFRFDEIAESSPEQ